MCIRDRLYSEENIESIKVTETENGYDASITIVDATKMTQYGFSSAVDNISSKYDIHHVTRNDLFIDSLPNGGLLNQKNMVLMGVAIFIIIVSALVIYNVFYLSVVNQVRQFGQLRTVGMTQQQTKKIIRYERKILCRIGVPIGLLLSLIHISKCKSECLIDIEQFHITVIKAPDAQPQSR